MSREERRQKEREERKEMVRHRSRLIASRQYPYDRCLIGESWENLRLTTVIMTRLQPDGLLTMAGFLVDLGCLGIKDAFYKVDLAKSTFEEYLSEHHNEEDPFVPCTPELAHQLIYGAKRYAKELGFRPHRDFRIVKLFLEPEDAYPPGDIEFGKNGKPYYFSTSHEDAKAVIKHLTKRLGPNGFEFIVGGPWEEYVENFGESYQDLN